MKAIVSPYYILDLLCFFFLICNAAVAQSAEQSKNFFQHLSGYGFSLQRALSGPVSEEAAAFSFLNSLENNTVYSADFALSWHPPNPSFAIGPFDLSFSTSLEGALTSDESEAEDALRLRASIIGDMSRTGPIDSTYASVSLKYESDQDFDTQKVMTEMVLTPTVRKLALGKAWPQGELNSSGRVERYPPLQFLWRPFIGLDLGYNLDSGQSAEVEETILRLLIRGRVQLLLNFVAQALNLQETAIFLDNTFYYLPLESSDDIHNLLVAGIEFLINENVSVELIYKNGEASPNFEHIETLGGNIGIRF